MSTPTIQELDSRITKIEQRNKKVENDKAWETSLSRRLLLIGFTYLSISLYLNAIAIERPWLNAIVPAIGFFLSTLTLPALKSLWEKHLHHS